LLSLAKDFGCEKYIKFDKKMDAYYQTEKFENEMGIMDAISDYHEYALWEGLVLEFSKRDMISKYGANKVEKMSEEERIIKEYPFIVKYEEEIRENGLENIIINTKKKFSRKA